MFWNYFLCITRIGDGFQEHLMRVLITRILTNIRKKKEVDIGK